jgi:urease accessory protein
MTSFCLFLISGVALAHPVNEVQALNSFLHPFLGADHLLTALAVGMVVSQIKKGKLFAPLSFLTGMIIGCSAGISHFALPFTETGILISVAIMGILLFYNSTIAISFCAPMLMLFGFFHGSAHGLELQGGRIALLFATLIIHASGYGLVVFMKQGHKRLFGIGIASFALLFFLKDL